MKTYEVNIKLKRNRIVTVYLSPNKDEDIFVDEKASGVPFQLIEGKRYYFELSDADFYIDGDPQVITCYPSRSGVSNGTITTNVIHLDKELKDKFKEVWQKVVPVGSPFKCEYRNPFTYMDSEPFWDLSTDKDRAFITWEALYAFSHEASRSAIMSYLIRSIKDDTISEQYSNDHPTINWMVAEDIMGIIPLIGFLVAG